MDNSARQNLSQSAGEAKGQTQEKASNILNMASNAANSAKESRQEAGGQMQQKARSTFDAAKDAIGMTK